MVRWRKAGLRRAGLQVVRRLRETSVSPSIQVQALRRAGSCLAPAPDLGKFAVSLAPCVRCDVRLADMQVGRTVFEFGE